MIEGYIDAAIRQAQERARILKGKISYSSQVNEFIALRQTCDNFIDGLIDDFGYLLTDSVILRQDLVAERIRLFRRLRADLMNVETTVVAALARSHADDAALSRLVADIHREIRCPLAPPTVTSLSREYFSISPVFRLLEVPLAESDFLLHLPDLYHEIAHPLITEVNNPVIEPYQLEYSKFLGAALAYFVEERKTNLRSTGPRRYFGDIINTLEYAWAIGWANEIFCDLFAIYTLGPAYAWAHFHLTARHDADPYEVQFMGPLSHPPDHARMEAMLIGLDLIGFADDAAVVRKKWQGLLDATGATQGEMFRRACPSELLERAAIHALEGVKRINCRIVNLQTTGKIHDLLNTAWEMFWSAPNEYHSWERGAVTNLKEQAVLT